MTMTTRDAFQTGTDTFSADDVDAFAEVLADDVVFLAPGGMRGERRPARVGCYGSWFGAFPDTHVEVGRLMPVWVNKRRKATGSTRAGSNSGVSPHPPLEVNADADDLSRVLAEAVMRRQAGER